MKSPDARAALAPATVSNHMTRPGCAIIAHLSRDTGRGRKQEVGGPTLYLFFTHVL